MKSSIACCGGILYRDGKILLGLRSEERSSFPGVWDIIGGRQELGETIEETLERELEEELGITSIVWDHLETIHISDKSNILECHIYLVSQWSGIPENKEPHEHQKIEWFPILKACQLHLACLEYSPLFEKLIQNKVTSFPSLSE